MLWRCSNKSGYNLVTLEKKKGLRIAKPLDLTGGPTGIRTPVLALRGPRPRPLDDRTKEIISRNDTISDVLLSTGF